MRSSREVWSEKRAVTCRVIFPSSSTHPCDTSCSLLRFMSLLQPHCSEVQRESASGMREMPVCMTAKQRNTPQQQRRRNGWCLHVLDFGWIVCKKNE